MGKRILAYLIDVVIVLFASSMLSSISYLNPQLETYNKYYDEFLLLQFYYILVFFKNIIMVKH